MKQLLLILSIALLAIGCSTIPDDGVHTTYYQNGQLRSEEITKTGFYMDYINRGMNPILHFRKEITEAGNWMDYGRK